MQTKNIIKIPKNITVIYVPKKKTVTFIGPLAKKTLQLNVKLKLLKERNTIEVTQNSFVQLSNYQKKQVKAIQRTTVALIKQMLIETSTIVYGKLKFVGVGYRAFNVEEFKDKLLMFKLGYSHSLYYKIPDELKMFCLRFTKLFIYGNSYQNVTQAASTIRSYKKPEPYKGKGITYENEKIILKEGKKV